MRATFRGGTLSQFILHGNVFDLVPAGDGAARRFVPLSRFLVDVLFEPFDVVLFYNRGKGLRAGKGDRTFNEFLEGFDRFNQTTYASAPLTLAPSSTGASWRRAASRRSMPAVSRVSSGARPPPRSPAGESTTS